MADAVARRSYASETRPVATKQMAQKDSGAHPDHAGVDDRAGGPTESWVDVYSNHCGASNVDGEVPVAAVSNLIKHQGTSTTASWQN